MASSRYKFFDNIYNVDIARKSKGVPTVNLKDLFTFNDDISYRIPLEFRYRPDLIANKFYGNTKLFWILVYVNDFSNSPEDFEVDTVIRIPRFERVSGLV